MADIINLNKYRKARRKAEESSEAAENRVRHGRTKAEKSRGLKDAVRSERELDDKRMESPDDDQEPA